MYGKLLAQYSNGSNISAQDIHAHIIKLQSFISLGLYYSSANNSIHTVCAKMSILCSHACPYALCPTVEVH